MDKKSALEAFVLLAHVLCEYANRVKSLNLVETYYLGCWYIEDKILKNGLSKNIQHLEQKQMICGVKDVPMCTEGSFYYWRA